MSRIALPDREDAPLRSKPVLDAVSDTLGMVPNMFRLVANSPEVLGGFAIFENALARTLDPQTRERIALAVAQVNGSPYCLAAHSYLANTVAKLSPAEIALARAGGAVDEKADAAVRFAAKVAEERGHVSDVDIHAVRRAGYNDAEIVEIIAHVAAGCFMNFLDSVAQTEIDFPSVHEIQ